MPIWLCSQPKKKHLDSRWTPENHLDSGGVHLEYVGQGKVLGGVVVCVVWVFLGWVVLIVRGRCVIVRGWGQWWWWVRRIWTSCMGNHTSCVRVDGWGVVVRQGAAAGPGW